MGRILRQYQRVQVRLIGFQIPRGRKWRAVPHDPLCLDEIVP